MDADSRFTGLPPLGTFPPGLSVIPMVRRRVAEHLETTGSWRMPFFRELARYLTGGLDILSEARWCRETPMGVTKDGRESVFFDTWGRAAEFLQSREVYSGEGGVIGLAAACAGWNVNYDHIIEISASISHEGGGPKRG